MKNNSIALLFAVLAFVVACGGEKQEGNLSSFLVTRSTLADGSDMEFATVEGQDFQSEEEAEEYFKANEENLEWQRISDNEVIMMQNSGVEPNEDALTQTNYRYNNCYDTNCGGAYVQRNVCGTGYVYYAGNCVYPVTYTNVIYQQYCSFVVPVTYYEKRVTYTPRTVYDRHETYVPHTKYVQYWY